MPRNKIEDLRNHLFEVIERLKDGDIELEQAKAINDVSKTLVSSAKVEVQYMKVFQSETGSGFFPTDQKELSQGKEG